MMCVQYQKSIFTTLVLVMMVLTAGCLRYLTHERSEVLIKGIDIDQTLLVAEITMKDEKKWGSVLTLWAIRDQVLTAGQAEKVSRLYFKHIANLKRKFIIWHLTWTIANMYRLGDEAVKAALQKAYDDAQVRAKKTHRIANLHVNGEKLYMGDAHSGGEHMHIGT